MRNTKQIPIEFPIKSKVCRVYLETNSPNWVYSIELVSKGQIAAVSYTVSGGLFIRGATTINEDDLAKILDALTTIHDNNLAHFNSVKNRK